ncbi:VQ motif-containing protein 4 [Linum perenne]
MTRSDSINPYPTTFSHADTSSFKLVVQMLTSSLKPDSPSSQPDPTHLHPKSHSHSITLIKFILIKRNQSSSFGFKLYERRNSLKNLKIKPLNPFLADFPALAPSPFTPLIPDPFERSGFGFSSSPMSGGATLASNMMETKEEEKGIKERGFYLHRFPATAIAASVSSDDNGANQYSKPSFRASWLPPPRDSRATSSVTGRHYLN